MSTTPTITASGTLWLDPRAETVRFKHGWAIVQVDAGITWLYREWIARRFGEWVRAVDPSRDGGHRRYVEQTPRLTHKPLLMEPPAWGPHISVLRGERPKRHADLWKLRVRIQRLEVGLERKGTARIQADLDRAYSEWDRKTARLDVPTALEGRPVQFSYIPMDLQCTSKGHWSWDVECPELRDVRGFFGLRPEPYVPFHLTIGITPGTVPSLTGRW